jgi:hypothetical protein
LICLTLSWLLHDSMCYIIVVMSSLFYNVKKQRKTLEWVGMSFWLVLYIEHQNVWVGNYYYFITTTRPLWL